ncbi:ABC-2 type transport system permease protein [Desulfotomaculum arcticum]|uniref:Transport permease protein n=1 Tax=Desulfotruncus arcticus DSM 17038 TaxID=1121424 RepID=A0A1I2X5N1_9FIRM|nr:ABC transporter permease [Desulfotruncus arcticus]SFH08808.1 ABC-2 type transport system permease protein [Desulfotomaculum arcticum] [Desulfotruncus arcticus DSM 17038]
MSVWTAFGSILMKDIKTYYLKPPNISWGIIFPFAWTLMFFLRSQSAMDIRDILPGIISISILFGTTSMLSVTITFERKSRSFERLLLAPISLNLLMLAKTTGAILFGIINAFVPVIFALFMTDLSGVHWLTMTGSVFLIALTPTFLGLFIAVSVSEVFEAQTFSNFFRFPMIFLCGLFIPVQELPIFLQPISYILPLTYGADILKTAISGNGYMLIWFSFLMLIGFSVALFGLSIINVRKKWIY